MVNWVASDSFYDEAKKLIKPTSVVIDIGCGIRPQQNFIPDYLICVEPCKEYTSILKKNLKNSNSLVLPFDAHTALSMLPDKSADSIFMIDVIEHMSREAGDAVLEHCFRIARRQIIVFTPLGFMHQEMHASTDGWNLNGGEFQEHKSGWYPEDFKGWDIVACKDIHKLDFKGRILDPPFGAFYAVYNFNDEEADTHIQDCLHSIADRMKSINAVCPNIVENIIFTARRDYKNKFALLLCQITTEYLIKFGSTIDLQSILELARNDISPVCLNDPYLSPHAIDVILKDIDKFEGYIKEREAEISERKIGLDRLEAEISERKIGLDRLEAEISMREAALQNNFLYKVFQLFK